MFMGSLIRVTQPVSNSSKAQRGRNAGAVIQAPYPPVYVAQLVTPYASR